MLVLGIDMATTFGLAVLRDRQIEFVGSHKLTVPDTGRRLQELWDWLNGHFAERPDLVVIEQYAYSRFGSGSFVLGEYGGVVRLLCGAYGVPYCEVAPTSLKKFVTGSGGKDIGKAAMNIRAYKRWNIEVKNDNESDALGLAEIGINIIEPSADMTKAQREVVGKYGKEIEKRHVGYRSGLRRLVIGAEGKA